MTDSPSVAEVLPAPAVTVEPAVSAPVPPVAETVALTPEEPVHPVETPTLLEKVQAKEPPQVEAKPPTEPEPKVEAKPEPQPPVAPFEYKYTLPETLKMDDTLKGEVHAALDAFRTDPSAGAQGLIDLHNKQMQAFATETLRNQIKAFNETRAGWVKEVLADPDLGGAGHDTAMGVVARMRDRYVSDHKPGTPGYASDMAAFNTMLRITGVGEHPVFLKLLKRVGRDFDEPEAPQFTPRPPPDLGKRPPGRLRDIYKGS
jgi:hypothetical protein